MGPMNMSHGNVCDGIGNMSAGNFNFSYNGTTNFQMSDADSGQSSTTVPFSGTDSDLSVIESTSRNANMVRNCRMQNNYCQQAKPIQGQTTKDISSARRRHNRWRSRQWRQKRDEKRRAENAAMLNFVGHKSR